MAILLLPLMTAAAQKTPSSEVWLTKADRSVLFEKQDKGIIFTHQQRNGAIIIDDRQSYQSVDGFGFALTGGSAFLIHRMSQEARTQLLKELFEKNDKAIGVSYLRLTIGASDMNSFVYSYDDMKAGESDPELKHFSLGHDMDDVIPVMKEILAINPNIKILASPWSAPAWMKTNGKVKGGALKAECYDVYAQYLVKYLQEMKKQGITIDAITVQNEPLNSNNTPSMPMSYIEESKFIRDYFGPQLEKAQVKVKIVLFDHNLDRPDYPLAILNDPATAKYVDGSGFHHYAGSMSTMSFVHAAHPEKNLYFTEQMTVEDPNSKTIEIADPVKTLVIDATRNWCRDVLLWNLAADKNNDPHTNDGGCSMCQGAITIDGDVVTRNLAYYTIAHASKLVPDGSVRINSTAPEDPSLEFSNDEQQREIQRMTVVNHSEVLPNVAFRTPQGEIILIVANTTSSNQNVVIQYNGYSGNYQLEAGSVATVRIR